MSNGSDLLAQAREAFARPGRSSPRIASWIARAALEEVVDELIRAKDADPGKASMSSRLSCLQGLYEHEPKVVSAAQYAWAGLSQASHQHAFQLDAVPSEVSHLMDLVSSLTEGRET